VDDLPAAIRQWGEIVALVNLDGNNSWVKMMALQRDLDFEVALIDAE